MSLQGDPPGDQAGSKLEQHDRVDGVSAMIHVDAGELFQRRTVARVADR